MFGLLKQKLTGFLDKLAGREEKKEPAQAIEERKEEAKNAEAEKPKAAEKKIEAPAPVEKKREAPEKKKEGHAEEKPAQKKKEKQDKPAEKEEKPKPEEKKEAPRKDAKPEPKIGVEIPAKKVEVAAPEKKETTAPKKIEIAEPKKTEVKPAPTQQKIEEKKTAQIIEPQKTEAKPAPAPQMQQNASQKIPEPAVQKAEQKPAGFSLGNIWPFGRKEEPAQAPPAPMKVAEKLASPVKPIEREDGKIAHQAKTQDGQAQKNAAQLEQKTSTPEDMDFERLRKKAETGEKKMEVKMGLAKTVGSLFSSEVQITEEDIKDLVEELELSMLEADVAYDVSLEISSRLRKELVGMRVPKSNMHKGVQGAIAKVIAGVLRSDKEFDMVERVKSLPKPARILFIGPNGAGKTTTMAKIAKKLSGNGLNCVFAASDTFRAAAIEQLQVHADRLGIPLIKSSYGADPAAVAFDAVQYAKAHEIHVVLIDSSGRQDTNANLLDELKKIVRIIKPDLKIYIGESIGGNAVVGQISAFAESVGLDGVVLTKLDCDAKGGTALSVSHATGVPILYFGVGQEYADLQKFDADELANSLVSPPEAS